MSCDNYSSQCADLFSSNCVIWKGPKIECLGIEPNQSLTQIEINIASRVCELLGKTNVSNIQLCGELVSLVGAQDKSIGNLLQVLVNYSCTLRSLITSVEQQIGTGEESLNLDFKCLDTQIDPCEETTYTLRNVLQIIINSLCTIREEMDNLKEYVDNTTTSTIGNFLANAFQSCLDNRISVTGTGSNTKVKLNGLIPPNTALPYFGSLSFFDGSGKGLDDSPMCGWYLCNGLNGTPDMRGRVAVGAIQGLSGGTLHAQVNPSTNGGLGNYTVNEVGGEIRHKLTTAEMPSHTHTDSGHFHTSKNYGYGTLEGDLKNTDGHNGENKPNAIVQTDVGYANLSSTGGDQFHENRMPYRACAWIMMII